MINVSWAVCIPETKVSQCSTRVRDFYLRADVTGIIVERDELPLQLATQLEIWCDMHDVDVDLMNVAVSYIAETERHYPGLCVRATQRIPEAA